MATRRSRPPDTAHWTVVEHRRVRTIWFAAAGLFVGLQVWSAGHPGWVWGLLGLQFLLYPQVLYWHARRARDTQQAELNNLLLDSAVMGAWAAALAFPLWITFTLFINTAVGNALTQGWRGVLRSVGLFAAGALALAAANDWEVTWQHGPWVAVLCVITLVWYLLTVGVAAYSRTLALRAIREKLKQRERELQAANQALFVRLSEIEHLQGILKEQANIDALTGLFNRRYLQSTLDREWARSLREQQPLCVVLIDIDHFKRVNDTHGHGVGDEVLVAMGRLLATGVRTEDLACRYGGEEFLVLMPKMPLDMALERAEQWRRSFAELDIRVAGARLALTMSLGVAVAPEHAASPEELVRHADEALYRAKAQGRNQVVVFSRPDAPGE